jgi:2-phosphoglycerate kinase
MIDRQEIQVWSQRRIIWIGGSPCAGKSTLATRLAEEYGSGLYRCDEALEGHLRRITPTAYPLMHTLANSSWNDIWGRPVDTQIGEELAFYREEFPLILEDLRDLPAETPVIVEGTALLPELVAPLLTAPQQALWLVPSAAFQREHYARRPWIHDILRQCDDPAQAFENWMQRDIGFADTVERQARERQLRVLRIDGTMGVGALRATAKRWLQLSD